MLWIKSLHLIFVVSWFAGLFYLPRLFVYHAQAEDPPSRERFKVMERRLYRGIMTPAMILTVGSGLWLWFGFGFDGAWLYTKVFLVVLLLAYHFWMRRLMRDFALERNTRDHVFYRWVNEMPTVLLVAIVILAVVKPF